MSILLKNKRVIVLGLGKTGLSTLLWLQHKGAVLSVMDTRLAPPELSALKQAMPEVTIYLGELDAARLITASLIVVSPGIALNTPAIEQAINAHVPVIGDVELFAQYRPVGAKVIAITGSNGKSTVTTLVGEMCKAAGLRTIVAGNIGLPVLDALQMPPADVYVLELSSFQLEVTANLVVDAAAMLNLSEDHMDRYEDIAAYAQAKARIFYHAKHQVLNRDDAWSMVMTRTDLRMRSFGLAEDENQFCLRTKAEDVWLSEGKQLLVRASDLQIKGLHNLANGLAALALCSAIDLEYATLIKTLKAFKGLPHRMVSIGFVDGVEYFDDSKATNVGATCAALLGLGTTVLIAGGDGKGQDFTPLTAPVAKNARAVILFGKDAAQIEQVLSNAGAPLYRAKDLPEAVVMASKLAQAGDAVLLSPACASFDMFENYIHRAEVFAKAVQRLEAVTC